MADYHIKAKSTRSESNRPAWVDEIIAAVRGDHSEEGEGEGDRPEVTFEPEESQLPTTSGDEEESDDVVEDNGEGSTNVEQQPRAKFGHPSSKPRPLIEVGSDA